MKFTPKSEDQLTRFKALPEGDYSFTVLESEEVASKSAKNSGKIMCKLKLAVHDTKNDRDQWVWDYFADWFSEWKLKHFADTTGHGADYQSGSLDVRNNNAQGWTGRVRLIVEVDDKGNERNAVDDYIVEESVSAQVESQPGTDDDVPF